jgi:hypothetical protein
MTYIHAVRCGNKGWTAKVEEKNRIWASSGEYLRGSTLLTLARNISGFEPPPSLYAENTFEEAPSSPRKTEEEENKIVASLSQKLRNAIIDSLKSADDSGGDSTSDSDNDDESCLSEP